MTSVLLLMIRYVDLLVAEAARMRIAGISRGDSPRRCTWPALSPRASARFLRSYETR